jgi:hypothetical protein
MRISEWTRQGRLLGALGRASGWWIGDWIRYGKAHYGDKYTAAIQITGYDAQSLMNMAYVAGRFEVSRRREGLSFSHHAELAGLPPDDQDLWLDRAEAGRLSVRGLRSALRDARPGTGYRPAPRRVAAGEGVRDRPLPRAHPVGDSRLHERPQLARDRGTPTEASASNGPEVLCPKCGHRFQR